MGYECKYSYYDRKGEGYDESELKTFKKKVGDPFEDITLERLAVTVMAQRARRDIWIVDIEIVELSKKPVSFKETKGGIVLKNKKFLFDGIGDDASAIVVQELAPEQPKQIAHRTEQLDIHGVQPHVSNRHPLKWMIFSPELQQMSDVRKKGLKFTVDKKYPIYDKKPGPLGSEIFTTLDDAGREQTISDTYFIEILTGLSHDRELGFTDNTKKREGGSLYWGGASQETDMIDIRKPN